MLAKRDFDPGANHLFFVLLGACWVGFSYPKTGLNANTEQDFSTFTPIVRGLPGQGSFWLRLTCRPPILLET